MIEIKTVKKGAELVSAKFNGIEKIHDGESFWNRHAPILFPIVGKLKDGKTQIDNKIYEMGQHGFARDMEFEEIGENSYLLKSNEQTLKKFPFEFELYVSYEVSEDEIYTKYKVINKDSKNMIFGLGGHPAFRCEYSSGKYRLEFEDEEENIEFYQLENGLVKQNPENPKKFLRENRIFLDRRTFENDAIIMKNFKSHDVYLKTETKTILGFNFSDFPYLAIWSKPDAPFICIEPWFNTADKVNSNGIFEEKEDLIELKPNQKFETQYKVKFFN